MIVTSKKGFTLVEAMVAIAIIMLSIVGPMYVANRAIVVAQIASNQLIASYLAQEGIEYIRTVRDHDYLLAYQQDSTTATQYGWDSFIGSGPGNCISGPGSCITGSVSVMMCGLLPGSAGQQSYCTLDPLQIMGTGSGDSIDPCGNGNGNTCSPLYLESDGVYTQSSSGNTLTPFTRTIQVTTVSSTEVRVTSVVAWSMYGQDYSESVIDHLTPWQ